MPEKIIEQSKQEAKKKDEVLTKETARQFSPVNIKDKFQEKVVADKDKFKIVESVVYKNKVE